MAGILCGACGGLFPSAKHPCAVPLLQEVNALKDELMRKDAVLDYERGELEGQERMLKHIIALTEESNSLLARTIRNCPLVKDRAEVLRQVAENLECASYKLGETFDSEAAEDLKSNLDICQSRAERLAGKKEE